MRGILLIMVLLLFASFGSSPDVRAEDEAVAEADLTFEQFLSEYEFEALEAPRNVTDDEPVFRFAHQGVDHNFKDRKFHELVVGPTEEEEHLRFLQNIYQIGTLKVRVLDAFLVEETRGKVNRAVAERYYVFTRKELAEIEVKLGVEEEKIAASFNNDRITLRVGSWSPVAYWKMEEDDSMKKVDAAVLPGDDEDLYFAYRHRVGGGYDFLFFVISWDQTQKGYVLRGQAVRFSR